MHHHRAPPLKKNTFEYSFSLVCSGEKNHTPQKARAFNFMQLTEKKGMRTHEIPGKGYPWPVLGGQRRLHGTEWGPGPDPRALLEPRGLSRPRWNHLFPRPPPGPQDARAHCPAEAATLTPTTALLEVLHRLTKKRVAREVHYMRHPLQN